MCTGACILYKVARVVIGENTTFVGGEAYLKQRGVKVVVLQNKECETLMQAFVKEKPDLWLVPLSVRQLSTHWLQERGHRSLVGGYTSRRSGFNFAIDI